MTKNELKTVSEEVIDVATMILQDKVTPEKLGEYILLQIKK